MSKIELVPIDYDFEAIPSTETKAVRKDPKTRKVLEEKTFDSWGRKPLENSRSSTIVEMVQDSTRFSRGAGSEPNRIVAMVRMSDGRTQPFYISTGAGGKKGVETGKWYPFFGTDENGWLRKGQTDSDILNFYGSEELKKISDDLNSRLGNLTDPKVRAAAGFEIPRVYSSEGFRASLNRDMPSGVTREGSGSLEKLRTYVGERYQTPESIKRTMAAAAADKPIINLPDTIDANKGVPLSEMIEKGPYTPPTPPPPPETLIQNLSDKTPAPSVSKLGKAANWAENITGGTFTRGGALGTAGVSLAMGGYQSFSEQMDAYRNQNPVIRDEDPWYPNARDFEAFSYAASKPETYYNTGVYTKDNIQAAFGNPAKMLEKGDTWTQRTFGPEQVARNPALAASAIVESTGRGTYNVAKEFITEDIPWLATEGIPMAAQGLVNFGGNVGKRIGEAIFPDEQSQQNQKRIEQIDNDAKYMF